MPGYLLTDICRKYRSAKLMLLNTLLHLTEDRANIKNFDECKVLEIVKPFLSDTSTEVQNAAIVLIIQIAEGGLNNASMIISSGVIPELLRKVAYKERFYQISVFEAITTIGTYSEGTATAVLDAGGLEYLSEIFSYFDMTLLSHAVYTVGKLGAFPATAASFMGPNGILDSFCCLLRNQDVNFLKTVVSAMGDIAFVSQWVAEYMTGELLEEMTKLLDNHDLGLKEKVLGAIARIAFHSPELSEEIVRTGVLPKVLNCLQNDKGHVRKYAIDAVIQMAKHTQETAQTVVDSGAVQIIKDIIKVTQKTDRRKCIELLGIMAKSEEIAEKVAVYVISSLTSLLKNEADPDMKCSIVWTLGELGKFSKCISCKIADEDFLQIIIENLTDPFYTDCCSVFLNTYKVIFNNCMDERMIRIFLSDMEKLPTSIVEHATQCLSTLLPNEPKARMHFFEMGALKRLMCIQHIKSESFLTSRDNIMACYPENTLREMQLRLTRDEGVRWEQLAPYCPAAGERARDAASAPWVPRPFRFFGGEALPPPSAAEQELLTPQVSDTGERAAAEARRAAVAAATQATTKLLMEEAVAVALGQPPRPCDAPPPERLAVPRLRPGRDLGPLPSRFSCRTCCHLLTAVEEPCCKDVEEGVGPDRVCHAVPQNIPDSGSDNTGANDLAAGEEAELRRIRAELEARKRAKREMETLHRQMEARPVRQKPAEVSMRTMMSADHDHKAHRVASGFSPTSIADSIPSSITCCDLDDTSGTHSHL